MSDFCCPKGRKFRQNIHRNEQCSRNAPLTRMGGSMTRCVFDVDEGCRNIFFRRSSLSSYQPFIPGGFNKNWWSHLGRGGGCKGIVRVLCLLKRKTAATKCPRPGPSGSGFQPRSEATGRSGHLQGQWILDPQSAGSLVPNVATAYRSGVFSSCRGRGANLILGRFQHLFYYYIIPGWYMVPAPFFYLCSIPGW